MERKSSKARPETIEQVIEFACAHGLTENDGRYFWEKWNGNGFANGGKPIKDWQAVIRSWKCMGHCPSQKNQGPNGQHAPERKYRSSKEFDYCKPDSEIPQSELRLPDRAKMMKQQPNDKDQRPRENDHA